MKRALILLAGCVLLVGLGWFLSERQAAHAAARQQAAWQNRLKAERQAELNQPQTGLAKIVWATQLGSDDPATPSRPVPASDKLSPSGVPGEVDAGMPPLSSPAQTNTALPKKYANLRDPMAREALGLVGVDPDAEQYWIDAINDPDIPAKERQDLIEDLNEEGFPDPKNISLDDLPLIMNRLAIIEEHVWEALDDVNAAAFEEAYKDLMKMAIRLTQP